MRVALICLLLAGCVTTSQPLRGTGEIAPAPFGWDDHCAKIPTPDECRKKK